MRTSVLIRKHYLDVQLCVDVVCYIAVLLVTCVNLGNGTIQWMLKTKPIVFGKSVTLQCIVSDCCRSGLARQWKGHKNKPLSQDELTIDSSKYGSLLTTEGFSLTIHKFDINDANKNYTCVYGFDRTTKKLTLTEYELHPTNQTMKVYTNSSNSYVTTEIQFTKVYPVPKCKIMKDAMAIPLTGEVNETDEVDDYFLTANITLQYKESLSYCGDLRLTCTIGKEQTNQVVLSQSIPEFDCRSNIGGESTDNPGSKGTTNAVVMVVPVIVGLVVGVVVFVVVGGVIFKRKKKSFYAEVQTKKKKEKDKQEVPLNSLNVAPHKDGNDEGESSDLMNSTVQKI